MKTFIPPKNNAALRKLLREWQKRLRLLDWEIVTRFATKDDKIDAFGQSSLLPGHKIARVLITPTCDILPDWNGCEDLEVTLVHELLHFHADAFDKFFTGKRRSSHENEHYGLEFLIEIAAIAMVELKRGAPKKSWL